MTAPVRGVVRLLPNWNRVAKLVRARVREGGQVAIFLDFDGTLVDIAPRPELVRLKPAARRILQRLARHRRAHVFLISGRRREELLEHVGIRGIGYFGLYGWEGGKAAALPSRTRAELQRAKAQLDRHVIAYPAAWIENKTSSLSIHLLAVPREQQPRLRRELGDWLRPFRKSLRVIVNLRDVEVLPRSIQGKGAAVRRLLAQAKLRGAFPFYFGDDFSDESGFAAVRRGVSVHVGNSHRTRARYSVRAPAEVAIALVKLEAMLFRENVARENRFRRAAP
jgi:trehalose 6-phosphate phosphatase